MPMSRLAGPSDNQRRLGVGAVADRGTSDLVGCTLVVGRRRASLTVGGDGGRPVGMETWVNLGTRFRPGERRIGPPGGGVKRGRSPPRMCPDQAGTNS